MAIASSAIEMRSPAVSSMSSSRPRRQRADLLGEVEQLVGGVAHRRHGDDDVVAGLAGVDDALGDPLDALGVGDGRAAVLLHDQAHGGSSAIRRDCPQDTVIYGGRSGQPGARPAPRTARGRCGQDRAHGPRPEASRRGRTPAASAASRRSRDIDLDAPAGQVTALVGPNGSGKTTLFLVLATLLVPDAGRDRRSAGTTRSPSRTPSAPCSAGHPTSSASTTTSPHASTSSSSPPRTWLPKHDRHPAGRRAARADPPRADTPTPRCTSCRAARSSGSGWPARSCTGRGCWSSTSRPPASTRAAGSTCASCCVPRPPTGSPCSSPATSCPTWRRSPTGWSSSRAAGRSASTPCTELPQTRTRPWRLRALDDAGLVSTRSTRCGCRTATPGPGGVEVELGSDEEAADLVVALVRAGVRLVTCAPSGGDLEAAYLELTQERR